MNGPNVNILDLLIIDFLGNFEEQGGVHGPVVDKHTGGADAHRVHPGHVLRGGFQGGDDAVIVIVRVGVGFGEPDHLLGVNRLAVDDGGNFPVGPARVKADAAALHMAADGLGGILGGGNIVHQHHLKRMLENAGHVIPVKFLLASGTVDGFQVLADTRVAADVNLEAALHPEDGFYQALDVIVVGLSHLRCAVDEGPAGGHLAVGPLHGDAHRLFCRSQEGAVKPHEGDKVRVQGRPVFQFHIDAKTIHSDSPLSSHLICGYAVGEGQCLQCS